MLGLTRLEMPCNQMIKRDFAGAARDQEQKMAQTP